MVPGMDLSRLDLGSLDLRAVKLGSLRVLFEERSHRVLLLAGITGVATGASVAAFEWITRHQILDRVLAAPLPVKAIAPLIGLTIAALSLRYLGRRATPSTADEYIRNFHETDAPLPLRSSWSRLVASVATLGSGGAMGFEGPSLYLGSVIGTWLQTRFLKTVSRQDSKVLMVAGAAAGVAAIFKAPATGAVFALEVPFRDDTAKRMLLPALLAAATGYLTCVALTGITPIFEVEGTPSFDLRVLGGAVVLGLACGAGARGFAGIIERAKRLAVGAHPIWRVAVAGAALAALAVASQSVFGDDLALGAGDHALDWVTEPGHSLALIAALFAFRLAATAVTVGGGGVGGLFIPLVVAGVLMGDGMAAATNDSSTLFPVIGAAAFLGAGYRTPLAGVMFVAETTGRPGFVVPGLIASVAAQLVMGDVSVSPYQSPDRKPETVSA